jgi:hypothetical protein
MARLSGKQYTLLFIALFAILGLIALHIPMFQLMGAKAKFTLYDLFAPVATGFIGTLPGLIAVFFTQLFDFLLNGQHLDAATVVRFATPLAAALYFSRQRMWTLVIPVAAMLVFWSNPVGRSVWFYALFWLIPLAAYPFSERWLPARALGATFTAHAVGGAAYIYLFALPKSVWVGLIPVVAMERIAFAAGITLTYLVLNNLLAYIAAGRFPQLEKLVEQRFVWRMR